MQVGIIGGSGPLGRGLAVRLAAAGDTVILGSRDRERSQDMVVDLIKDWPEQGGNLVGGGNDSAAEADVVVVATPWDAALATVEPLRDALVGKVVISVGNALIKQGREMHALVPPRGSVAQAIQGALPQSMVVGAGHHLPAASLAALGRPVNCDVLICSDNPHATETAMALFDRIEGVRTLDAGSLSSSAPIEAFTGVLITLNMRYKGHATLQLAGLDHVHHLRNEC